MAPKGKPGKKASAQPKSAAATGVQRSPTKTAKKKAANSANAPPQSPVDDILDDFDQYRKWVRRADNDAQENSFSNVREDWDGLSEDIAVAFADAVRVFEVEEGVQTGAEDELREELEKVASYEPSEKHVDRRKVSAEAADLYKGLVDKLGVWQMAIEAVLEQLDAVDADLMTMPKEGLQPFLVTYQHKLRKPIETTQKRNGDWIQVFRQLAPQNQWTLEDVQKLQASAKELKDELSTAEPPSQSPARSSSSSSKRKRKGDAEESSSKAPRRSEEPDVTRSENARSGAARSQNHSSGRATSRDQGQAVGDTRPEQQGAAGHQQAASDRASMPGYTSLQPPPHPPNATQPEHAARDATTGVLRATPQPSPLPTIGTAGRWTQKLIGDLSQPSHSTFLSWCRRQFIAANYRTLEECEPLAEAVYAFHRRTLPDHDWENESEIPPLPMTAEDLWYFKIGFRNGRMWGNLRRLSNLRRDVPPSFDEYCNRNLANDRVYVANADSIARQILQLVQQKGLSRDWGDEQDVVFNIPPDEESTKNLPIEGLITNGYWNFRGVVGKGGNGRALLYCKYDSAGNILQRLISKESFVSRWWNSPSFWSGPVANRIPKEAGLHALFPRNPHIIEYLGFHVNKQLRMVRHYTVFAELGDLFSLSDNHARRVSAVDEHGVALPQPSIPVVAIIYMFQAMAAGACLMAHGAVPDDEGRWPGDQPPLWAHNIIHRDIKPLNYFLSSSESTLLWPKLPIVALGDFGNAIDATDHLFAQSSHVLGTTMWMAPEQFPHAPPQHQVSPATNVYQIGLTILHLMHLKDPMVQAKYGIGDPAVFPGFANDDLLYPQDLIDTAQGCIEMDPDERPTPVDLYKAIRDLATSYPDASDKKIPWQLQAIPPNQPLRLPLDKWGV